MKSATLLGLISAALCGCASQQQIAGHATTFNKAVEQTNNEMLLLNVLRASKRRPMHFSYISQVHGGPGTSLSSGALTIPFGGRAAAANATNSIAATLGYSGLQSYDVGVLDTSEFMRGLTTPIDPQVFEYYWSQGWPRELLWMLFVQRMEIKYGDPSKLQDPAKNLSDPVGYPSVGEEDHDRSPSKKVTFRNYPPDANDAKAFLEKSRQLLKSDFGLSPRIDKEVDKVGHPIPAANALLLKDLLALGAAKGLSIEDPKDGTVQLTKSAPSYVIAYPHGCKPEKDGKGSQAAVRAFLSEAVVGNATPSGRSGSEPGCQEITLYIRSPEAVIYYLGEIVRAQMWKKDSFLLQARACGERYADVPLFEVHDLSESRPAGVAVDVEFDGKHYGLAAGDEKESAFAQCSQEASMSVLSLVTQLIALQKSAKDLPTTGVVHVTN